MDLSSINWLAVVVCVIVSMVLGSIWFNPKTFFPMWWQAIGKAENQGPSLQNPVVMWGLTILAAFVQAVFMSLMVHALGSMMGGATLVSGALTGILLWLGFVAPSSLTNKLFANQLKAWMIESGNHLVNYILIGAILGAWH